ncbi:hypothetical protein Tco_0039820 [Tanacetum coccineum]
MDASMGLCECGNDKWRSPQNGTWNLYLSSKAVDGVKSQFIERVMSVIGLACTFESSVDTPLAIVALLTCSAAYYEK